MIRQLLPLLLACCFLSSAANAATKPNIILILSDDHTYSHYGFMGNAAVKTPNLDRMAGESLLYTRGYSMPVCSPSLATLLTGLLPSKHGISGNDLRTSTTKKDPRADRDPLVERLHRNPMILPKALSEAGYLTFQTGKLWNTSFKEAGFTHGMTKEESRHGGEGLVIGRKGMEPIHEFIDMAVTEQKPFFIWYAPMMPHDPHNPPERLLKKYKGKGPTKHAEAYYAMIEWFDETCGDVDAYLDKKGIKDNTLIIYLSDNGWDPLNGYEGGRAKLTPYENGIRTPIFVRWPGKVEPKRDESTPASIVDVMPTMLKAAGIEVPAALPGIDLGDQEAMAKRNSVEIESYTHDIVELDAPEKSLTARVLIDGWTKLIVPGPVKMEGPKAKFATIAGVDELFDLKADPKETRNLATEKPDEVKRLKALLKPLR
ncbi:MAG: sulfatase [Verrucomicrobiales bacterium]